MGQSSEGFSQKVVADVMGTWREIGYMSACAIGVALGMVIFLRIFAGLVIWLIVIVFTCAALGTTGFVWYIWYEENAKLDLVPKADRTPEQEKALLYWFIYACVASGITAIFMLIVLVLRKRIALVVALFKEAGKAVGSMPLLLLQPLWTILALGSAIGGVGFIFLYVLTADEAVIDADDDTVTFVPEQQMWASDCALIHYTNRD
ncbi:PREDICTED: choline transporter-like protein 1 [Priapulus caudatus]|uniref:Choline transporter-like protein n=1 Tax=Priapulus caudatus TaxID=37621 RepID=A0ABM1DRN6_PRICU|nr:PREDICTED: choline transporter-like protein 1 [Priapulus caudatus]